MYGVYFIKAISYTSITASYRQSVEEELAIGQLITIVSAMDADQQDTPNSEIVFSITDILGFDTVCLITLLLYDSQITHPFLTLHRLIL